MKKFLVLSSWSRSSWSLSSWSRKAIGSMSIAALLFAACGDDSSSSTGPNDDDLLAESSSSIVTPSSSSWSSEGTIGSSSSEKAKSSSSSVQESFNPEEYRGCDKKYDGKFLMYQYQETLDAWNGTWKINTDFYKCESGKWSGPSATSPENLTDGDVIRVAPDEDEWECNAENEGQVQSWSYMVYAVPHSPTGRTPLYYARCEQGDWILCDEPASSSSSSSSSSVKSSSSVTPSSSSWSSEGTVGSSSSSVEDESSSSVTP